MEPKLVTVRLYIPTEANPRFADLSRKEVDNGRIIGGDLGDLRFWGYTIERGRTRLDNPELLTNLDIPQDEANTIAQNILASAFESIGAECIEHN